VKTVPSWEGSDQQGASTPELLQNYLPQRVQKMQPFTLCFWPMYQDEGSLNKSLKTLGGFTFHVLE
jgi:hypothetical protein